MNEKMTAVKALAILQQAVVAADYLENVAQTNVNADGRVIADMVKANEDVDGRGIFGSWKAKVATTKFGVQAGKMIRFAEATVAYESKVKAIPTTSSSLKAIAA